MWRLRELINRLIGILSSKLFNVSDLMKLQKYSKDILELLHTARDLYQKNILPLITVEISGGKLAEMIYKNMPAGEKLTLYVFDGKYYVPDKEAFELIASTGIQKELKYRSEVFDCDDFAFGFKAYASEIYLINSVGIAIGRVIDDSGKVGYHAWNIALIYDADGVKLVTYEPQSGQWSEGIYTKVGGWKYEPDVIII